MTRHARLAQVNAGLADPYGALGVGYADARRPDPRIAAQLHAALGEARTVLNVGAGAGSYEPDDRHVVAVEPSATMLAQRAPGSAPAVQASAEELPFDDGQFDVGLAILTVHHWTDPQRGLAELRRVSRRQVVLTWDAAVTAKFWLIADYLPGIAVHERGLATLDAVVAGLPGADVEVVEVPWDCTDGFLAAYWRQPRRYLDAGVRAAMSGVARQPDDVVEPAMRRLQQDLDTGAWSRRNAGLLRRETFDGGYRLVVSPGRATLGETG